MIEIIDAVTDNMNGTNIGLLDNAGEVSVKCFNPNGIKLYSNQIGTQLVMEFKSEANNLSYDVINAKGKSFLKKAVQKSLKETINIANLDKGSYFIRLRSDNVEDFIKFVKK